MNKFGLPSLEWEILHEPITINNVGGIPGIVVTKNKLRIYRDEDYNLKGILDFTGFSSEEDYFNTQNSMAGSINKGFDIYLYHGDVSYTIESAAIEKTRITQSGEEEKNKGTAELILQRFKIKYNNRNDGTHFIKWYLNGPRNYLFYEGTERTKIEKFIRKRRNSEKKEIDSIEISRKSHSTGRDFLWIELSDFQFLVAQVPTEFGPTWSSNVGIEYRTEWGRIPTEAEKEKIEELCSFVFGKQLIPIGFTILDKKENIVENYCNRPWCRTAKSYCSNFEYYPIRVEIPFSGRAQTIISQLLPKYFDIRDTLRLQEALYYIWISREMPPGTNLPIFAAALESIINGWFNSKSESHGVYLTKEKFLETIEEEINTIRKKLDLIFGTEIETSQKIINKLLRANEFGVMERYRLFFDEIKLKVEPHEWKAIDERHKFVHGRTRFNDADWKKIVLYVNTYETLLNKVILKLLEYSGTYIDRSIIGWKDKQLG